MKDFVKKENILMSIRNAFLVKRHTLDVKSATLKNVLNVKKSSLLTSVIKAAQVAQTGKSMTQSETNVSLVILNFHSVQDVMLMMKVNLNVDYVSLET